MYKVLPEKTKEVLMPLKIQKASGLNDNISPNKMLKVAKTIDEANSNKRFYDGDNEPRVEVLKTETSENKNESIK